MLEDIIIVGVVMTVVQFVVKRIVWAATWDDEDKSRIVALSVLVLAGALNVANAAVFSPGSDLLQALREGITLGAVSGGVYSLGKNILGK